MKKMGLFAAATAVLAAGPASAQTLEDVLGNMEFKNRGQCQAALMKERNNRRVNDGNTGKYTDPEYNKVVHDKYECVEVQDGVWVVQVADDWD